MTSVYTLAADIMVGAAPPDRARAAAMISETRSEFGIPPQVAEAAPARLCLR
jgi:hypothetical protein